MKKSLVLAVCFGLLATPILGTDLINMVRVETVATLENIVEVEESAVVEKVVKVAKAKIAVKKKTMTPEMAIKKINSTVFVNSQNTPLYTNADIRSKKVTTLNKYDEVEVLEMKSIWYKVRSNKIEGWISKFQVITKLPTKESKIVKLKAINLKKHARKRASSYSTAATTRGLTDEDLSSKNIRVDLESVKEIEGMKTTTGEIKTFIIDGQLNQDVINVKNYLWKGDKK